MTEKNGSSAFGGSLAARRDYERPRLMNSKKLPPTASKSESSSSVPPQPIHTSEQAGMLDRSLQAQLGRQLRAIFSDVAEEPVPDRFVKLLEALESREKKR
jgi:hypothetical protein